MQLKHDVEQGKISSSKIVINAREYKHREAKSNTLKSMSEKFNSNKYHLNMSLLKHMLPNLKDKLFSSKVKDLDRATELTTREINIDINRISSI